MPEKRPYLKVFFTLDADEQTVDAVEAAIVRFHRVASVERKHALITPVARANDPSTSHEAASHSLTGQRLAVYRQLNSFPRSCAFIAKQLPGDMRASDVARRMTELQRAGLAQVAGWVTYSNGRRARCWIRTQKGGDASI